MSKAHTSTYFRMRGSVDKLLLSAIVFLSFLFVTGTDSMATTYPIMHNSSTANAKTFWNASGGWGVSATSKYGRFTCQTCHVNDSANPNIKRVKTSLVPPKGGKWASSNSGFVSVTFTNITGQFSFGDDTSTYNNSIRVCEVCHSKTNAHRYDNTGVASQHQGSQRKDCTTTCHPHSAGFKAAGGCTTCHGNPPLDTTIGTSTGLAGGTATLALGASPVNAGAHAKHNVQLNMACTTCHMGYAGTPNMGNGKIEMGFNVSAWPGFTGTVTQGSYTGASVLGGTYTWAATPSATPYAKIGTKAGGNSCNVYCHGNWAGSGGTRPAWTGGTADAQCGKCHGVTAAAPPTAGSHVVHAGNGATGYSISCTTCHQNVSATDNGNHIKGTVQWRFSTGLARVGAGARYNHTGSGSAAAGFTDTLAGTVASYGTCANIYCHSDAADGSPQYPLVTWGGATNTQCNLCHGGNATSTGGALIITTGRHTAHINNAAVLGANQNFTCGDCHAKTVSAANDRAVTNKALHINALKDYSGARAGKSSSYNEATNVCSNSYCHSSGKKGVGGVTEPTAPTWDITTALNCNGCHGTTNGIGWPEYTSAGTGVAGSNSHSRHISSLVITTTTGCYKCHRVTVDRTVAGKLKSYSSSHLNGKINPTMATLNNMTGHYNSVNKTCVGTYCHGAGASTPWGGASQACNSCHAANNLDGGWANNAHKLHLNSSTPNSFSSMSGNVSTPTAYRFACSACHNPAFAQHASNPVTTNQAAQVFFGYSTPGHAPAYTPGTTIYNDNGFNWSDGGNLSCNNTYCHSTGGGIGAAVKWNTSTSSGSCTLCHGSVRGSTTPMNTGKHKSHMNNYTTHGVYSPTCTSCHAKTLSDNTTIGDRRLHLNKFKNLSGVYFGKSNKYNTATKICTNVYCHSNGKRGAAAVFVTMTGEKRWTGTGTFQCNGCHGRSNSIGYPDYVGANSHDKHAIAMGLNDTKGCAKCHRDTANGTTVNRINPYSSNHLNGSANMDIRFDPIQGVVGSYNGTAIGTCSNTYCHGSTKTSPVWGTPITFCGQYCHSANSGVAPGNGAGALGGTHYKHYTSAVNDVSYAGPAKNNSTALNYRFTCKSCHNGTHANGAVGNKQFAQVINNYTAGGFIGVYNPSSNGSTDSNGYKFTAGGDCTNFYCHSDGNGTTKTIVWTGSVNADCTSCHGGARGSSTVMNSGKHNRHMNNWTTQGASLQKCQSCHASVISGNTTLINKRLHVNKIKNYSGLYAGDNYNLSNKTCTNFYCHSDSKGRYVNPGTWLSGAAKNCDGCHGRSADGLSGNSGGIGYPNYTSIGGPGAFRANSHKKHIDANGITSTRGCAKCHSRTADRNNANRQHPLSSNHLDGNTSFDVRPDTGFGVNYNYVGGTGFKNCSNITCHGSGRPGQYGSATWGATSLGCLNCHGGRTNGTGAAAPSTTGFKLSTTHMQHLKYSVTSSPLMNCNVCHSKTALDGATLKPYTSAIYHANGTPNVRFTGIVYASITSYKTGTKKCSNTACHGGITRNAWGTTYINTDNTCVHCHGVAGTAVGNSTRNNFAPGWANSGIDTDGTSAAGGIRVGAHFVHLSSIYMKKLKCNECHLVPSTPFDSNAPNHMEALRYNSVGLNFSQASSAKLIGGGSRSTLATFSGYTAGVPGKAATCSSVYCHGSRMKYADTSGNYTKPSWALTTYTTGTPSNDCGRCHGNPPTAGSKAAQHTGVAAAQSGGCTACHSHVSTTGFITNKDLHINGIVEGAGACNGCHDYDVSPFGTWTGKHTNYGTFGLGGGVHAKHISYLKTRFNITLYPDNDSFGINNAAKVCGVCHSNNTSNHSTGTSSNPRNLTFDTFTAHHHTAAGSATYNGSSATSTTKTCSNIDCHYKTSPVW